MSHSYDLRPNARGRMQRQLDAHVADFGKDNKDEVDTVPSNTGEGVLLNFDPKRLLSPGPDQAASRQGADSTEGVVIIDDSDCGDSLTDLGSGVEAVAPDSESPLQRSQAWPISMRRRPPGTYSRRTDPREVSIHPVACTTAWRGLRNTRRP